MSHPLSVEPAPDMVFKGGDGKESGRRAGEQSFNVPLQVILIGEMKKTGWRVGPMLNSSGLEHSLSLPRLWNVIGRWQRTPHHVTPREMDNRDVAKTNPRPFPFTCLTPAPLALFSHTSHLTTAQTDPCCGSIKMRMLALATRTYDPAEPERLPTAPCSPIASPRHAHHISPVAAASISPLAQQLRRQCHASMIVIFSIGLQLCDSLSQLGNFVCVHCKSFAMLVFALFALYCVCDGEDCPRVF